MIVSIIKFIYSLLKSSVRVYTLILGRKDQENFVVVHKNSVFSAGPRCQFVPQ